MRRPRRSWSGVLLVPVLLAGCTDTAGVGGGPPTVSFDFEGASLGAAEFSNDTVMLTLRHDTNAQTRLWFSFRLANGAGRPLTYRLDDALGAASASTWSVKRPVVSSDRGVTWSRVQDAHLDDPAFVFDHTAGSESEWFALALPYDFSRWQAVVDTLRNGRWVASAHVIGASIGGNAVEVLRITDPSVPAADKSGIWVVARQHPGEPEGSYMLEGFLRWLRGDDEQAAELRRLAEVFVVGFLNPDGVLAGNQRVNQAGLDLNRQWAEPDPATAPTIHALQREILDYTHDGGRVRILVDFHAAPGGRSNFFFYNDAATSSPELFGEVRALLAAAIGANPDFVPLEGSTARPTTGGARARSWAFDRLGTHGLTVEASSNDVTYGPFRGQYATEARLWALGQAVGVALAEALFDVGSAGG